MFPSEFLSREILFIGMRNPYTYTLLSVGFLCLGVFAVVERRPLCPLPRAVFTGDLAWAVGRVAAGWSSFKIIIYYFYQFVEVIKGDSPLLATAAPYAIAWLVTGFLLGRWPPSVIMLCAMALFTTGLSIFATVLGAFVDSLITSWGMDMSFPSRTIILSNAMHCHHQGLAASLVATTVDYSISMGLGFAGTVESHVDDAGRHVLQACQGALYLCIGLAGLGLVVCICFKWMSWRWHHAVQEKHVYT
ncbi:uncharacterized protein N7482_000056 [Penicillium canariense]|uniref:Uncharacterized protein n=1 Tax=Penicillium canariense TaxID=189055 RepID=A0A9W9IDH4_9EURO|nr:uncharacterized protein N7482_000056 [Penicillium canariense]KAJ5174179.1 hypothetical protein N7482_000056 [Penicillium canariense]